MPRVERIGYVLGGTAAMIGLLGARGFGSGRLMLPMLGVCALAAVLVVWGWAAAWRGERRAAAALR